MDINIITTFQNAQTYLRCANESSAKMSELWTRHMIEPFWDDIAAYAPFDQSWCMGYSFGRMIAKINS